MPAASHRDATHLSSVQEEADTNIMLHVSDAKSKGAIKVVIHSPDTDVLVLVTRHFNMTCAKILVLKLALVKIVDLYQLDQCYHAIGTSKAAALHPFMQLLELMSLAGLQVTENQHVGKRLMTKLN